MAALGNVIKLTTAQYNELKTNGSITVGGVTYNYDPNTLYLTDANESAVPVYISQTVSATNSYAYTGVSVTVPAGAYVVLSARAAWYNQAPKAVGIHYNTSSEVSDLARYDRTAGGSCTCTYVGTGYDTYYVWAQWADSDSTNVVLTGFYTMNASDLALLDTPYVHLSGDAMTGDLILKNSGTGTATPRLIFQKGDLLDSNTDWSLNTDTSGTLNLKRLYNNVETIKASIDNSILTVNDALHIHSGSITDTPLIIDQTIGDETYLGLYKNGSAFGYLASDSSLRPKWLPSGGTLMTLMYDWGDNPQVSSGGTIIQPSGTNAISLRTNNAANKDTGIFRLTDDNAYICNSSDEGYAFAVFDTDKTLDFSQYYNAAFAVRSDHAGVYMKGTLSVNEISLPSQQGSEQGTVDGDVVPVQNNHYYLGINDHRWAAVYSNGYYPSSDRRLKKDIKDTELSASSILSKMSIKDFKWKDTDKDDIGVIAQEVLEILPEKYKKVFIDGTEKDEKTMLSISLTPFVMLSLKAIQEQQEKIKELEERIKELEK